MATEVILPKVDMDMATGIISAWLVEDGARVEKGQPLFEIETDKAAMEIEAPASGVLVKPAATRIAIPVGDPVGWILAEGEAAPAEAAPAVSAVAAAPETAPAPVEAPAVAPPAAETGAIRATPLARRMARDAGIDLASIAGSGPRGRITAADVEAASAAKPAAMPEPAPAIAAAPATAAPAPAVAPPPLDPGVERIPHDSMRRTIARRLTESKQTVPHFYLTADCRLDSLLTLREEINAGAPRRNGEPAYRISVNDMVVKALALALQAVPDANVTWADDALLRYRSSDVGVAVSVPGGLITPVVRRADEKSLSAISREIKDLAERARARKLRPEEYQGGTTSVSNLGMFGVRDFGAIINPPQSSILAVGAGERRIVEIDGAAVGATMMTVTLSVDHRAIDGALGATLLAAFKALIERPIGLLV